MSRNPKSSPHARRGAASVVLMTTVLAASWGASPARGAPERSDTALRTRARYLMGTVLSVTMPGAEGMAAFEAAFGEVARLETILSNWNEASEISRLNRRAAEIPFRCSAALFDAVAVALFWSEQTEGAFDPTVEPLVQGLGLRGALGADGPDPSAPVGRHHLHLDPEARTVSFDASGTGIDLGGIGKGIALDMAARVLRGRGVERALLDFGGQVLALGAPPGGRAWEVGIADPLDRDAPIALMTLRDASLATSGNSERSVAGSKGPTGHILDPRSRGPATFEGSVTALAPDATGADALSTALFVMGPERGIRWAEERGFAALFMRRVGEDDLEVRASSGFAERLESFPPRHPYHSVAGRAEPHRRVSP